MAYDHTTRFNNLARRFDFDKSVTDKLAKEGCTSVERLRNLNKEEVDELVKGFILPGERSCIRGAIEFLPKILPPPDYNLQLRDDSESEIDHEATFRRICSRFNLNGLTIQVLRRNGCDSIPRLQFVNQVDMELLLLGDIEDIGQQSAFRCLISSLNSSVTQTTPESHSDGDIDIDLESRHRQIGSDLHEKIGTGRHFDEMLFAATGAFLTDADTDSCKDMRDLFKLLCKRGKIRLGWYANLYKIIEAAKLTSLIPVVKEGEDFINNKLNSSNDTGRYNDLHNTAPCSTEISHATVESCQPDPRDSVLPTGATSPSSMRSGSSGEKMSSSLPSSTENPDARQTERETDKKTLIRQTSSYPDALQTNGETAEKPLIRQTSSYPDALQTNGETAEKPLKRQTSSYPDGLQTNGETAEKPLKRQTPSCPDDLQMNRGTVEKHLIRQTSSYPDDLQTNGGTAKNPLLSQTSSCPDASLKNGGTAEKPLKRQTSSCPNGLQTYGGTAENPLISQTPSLLDQVQMLSKRSEKLLERQTSSCPDDLQTNGGTAENPPISQTSSCPDASLTIEGTAEKPLILQTSSCPDALQTNGGTAENPLISQTPSLLDQVQMLSKRMEELVKVD